MMMDGRNGHLQEGPTVDDWWNRPMRRATPEPASDGSAPAGGGRDAARCPWCSAPADPGAGCCPSCGATMAQRESLGSLVIPGVTDVDPGMRQPSLVGSVLATQARMNVLSAVGQAAGPSGQIVAAVTILAGDSVGGMFRPDPDPDAVGRPSQAALDMATRLDATGRAPTAAAGNESPTTNPYPDEPA